MLGREVCLLPYTVDVMFKVLTKMFGDKRVKSWPWGVGSNKRKRGQAKFKTRARSSFELIISLSQAQR